MIRTAISGAVSGASLMLVRTMQMPVMMRRLLLALHAKFCRPGFVPMVKIVTAVAWSVAIGALAVAYATGL